MRLKLSLTLITVFMLLASSMSMAANAVEQERRHLTGKEKFHHYVKGTYGRSAVLRSGAGAGLNQLRGHPSQWGGGPAGFGSRFGSAFGQHVIKGTIQYGVGTALKEDLHYYPSQRNTVKGRARDAVVHTFIVPRENGGRTFAVSRMAGSFGSGLISRAWYPAPYAGVGAGLASGGVSLGADVGANVFREFWPDLKGHLHRHHRG